METERPASQGAIQKTRVRVGQEFWLQMLSGVAGQRKIAYTNRPNETAIASPQIK